TRRSSDLPSAERGMHRLAGPVLDVEVVGPVHVIVMDPIRMEEEEPRPIPVRPIAARGALEELAGDLEGADVVLASDPFVSIEPVVPSEESPLRRASRQPQPFEILPGDLIAHDVAVVRHRHALPAIAEIMADLRFAKTLVVIVETVILRKLSRDDRGARGKGPSDRGV